MSRTAAAHRPTPCTPSCGDVARAGVPTLEARGTPEWWSRGLRTLRSRTRTLAAIGAAVIGLSAGADAALAQTSPALCPGDIAIVGWVDNGAPDAFAFVALRDIPATTVIYFTDNGWLTAGGFRNTVNTGSGDEDLCKWTANSPIAAGTIIRTTDTNADFTWTFGGSIPVSGGVGAASFANLALGASGGDQICAFQAPATNPLQNPSVHLYVLDDSNGFENAVDPNTGDVPPGLSTFLTAVTFNRAGISDNFMGFNTGSLASGNRARWVQQIANGDNWTFASSGTLPSGSLTVSAPAPSVTHIDTDAIGATLDGSLAGGEYGPANAYFVIGGGSGFGGALGAGVLFLNSTTTDLFMCFQNAATLNDVVVLYIDVVGCDSGHADVSMTDRGAGRDRRVISDLTSSSDGSSNPLDLLPIRPDFALTFFNDAGPGPDAYLYQLNANGSHTFLSSYTAFGNPGAGASAFREVSIPLSTLDMTPGQAIDLVMTYCSDTNFNSNESIPASPTLNAGANPGFGPTPATYESFARFVTYLPCTPPSVTDDPDALAACEGGSASFTVAASGTGLSYQWRKDFVNLVNGGAISGATTATLTINPAGALDPGAYDCVVTGSCGSATSAAAALTINPPTSIATNPSGGSVCPGGSFTFTVVAAGTGPFSYEWFRGDTPVGTDSPGLTIDPATPGDAGSYIVRVTGPCGAVDTTPAFLDVSDSTDPVLTPGSIDPCYASLALAEAAAIAATGASDNCGGAVLLSASTTGTCSATITVTGTDASGNSASVDYFTAIDATDPTINCPADVTILVPAAPASVTLALATASDACTGSTVITNSFNAGGPDASGLYPAGNTVVTFTAIDECGNKSACTVNVTVNLCPAPTNAYVDDDYTGLPDGTVVTWPLVGGSGSYTIGCDAFATIQGGLDAVVASTVYVAAGTYDQDITITLDNTELLGAGAATTIIRGTIGDATTSTIRIAANNVTVAGFTVTRLGNNPTDWNGPLNLAGLFIQGAFTGALIRDNIITGNRSGIDLNNTSGHTVRNNVIDFNHTGMIMRNVTDATTIAENKITNNRTVGILFLDASGGTNVPPQTFSGTVRNNDLSGNWYAQIEDRQFGGSLPAPGTTNLKNFGANWLGTTTPVISSVTGGEPGYAVLIPVEYGGAATPPGGQPDVKGGGVDNFDITPMLSDGADTDVSTGNGTFGFQGDFQGLTVTAELAQVGPAARIQEGHDEVGVGFGQPGVVDVRADVFSENVTITKHVEINGAGAGDCDTPADPLTQTVVTSAAPGQPVFTINDVGGADSANPLRLSAMRITGASGASDSSAAGVRVVAAAACTREFFRFDALTVIDNDGPGIVFESSGGAINSAEISASNLCENFRGVHVADAFTAFSGLALDDSTVKNNVFNGLSVHGNAAGTFTPTDINVSDSAFASNGQSSPAFQGSGDLAFFQFNGDASISNVTIDTTGRFPLQFRGAGLDASPGTWLPIGVVTIDGLDIDGTADRAALFVHLYADVDGLSLNNVDLSGVTNANPPFTGFSVGGMVLAHAGTSPLNLGNTVFPCQGVGYVGLGNFFTGGAQATCATVFVGASTLAQKEDCVFDVAENGAVGDVTFPDAFISSDPAGGTFCPGSTVILSLVAGGDPPLTYQWRRNTVPLADGGAISGATTPTLTINPAGAPDSGNYDVVVTGACGPVTSAVAAVDVSDTSDPTIICGHDQAANADTLLCTAPVPDFTAGVSVGDNCAVAGVTQSPLAGTPVGPGLTVVAVTVTDTSGNDASCTANFIVSDVTPPVISLCAPDQGASADALCTALVPDFTASITASDACGGVTVTQSPLAGTPVGLGATVVTLTVTDGTGLTATCNANFTVIDTTPPTISTCAPDLALSSGPGCFVALPDMAASVVVGSDCTPAVAISQSPLPGTLVPVGVTTVTFTATDGAGNFSTCTADVTVTGGGPQPVTYVDDDYTGLPVGTAVNFPHDGGAGPYIIGCTAFATIQGGVNGVAVAGLVNVAGGLYAEDVNVNKAGAQVYGAGAGSSIVEGVPGGDGATFRMAAASVDIQGFTITRQGNNLAQWNDPSLNFAGVAVQGITGGSISCCTIIGNRSGIDINNSNSISVLDCAIDFNRTGLILRNTTDNCTISGNSIADNWTVGLLFLNLDPAPQGADGTVISSNSIAGNWYADIQDRMTTADLKNFSGNWFGTTAVTISPVDTSEPGYAALIPVAYGGGASNPGGAPNIAGAGAFNIDFTPFLAAGADTSAACGFQPDLSSVWMTPRLAQTGLTNRTQEAHDTVLAGGGIFAEPGDYPGNLFVTKADITMSGPNAGVCTDSATVRSPEAVLMPGIADPTLDLPLIYVTASGLTIDGFTLDADNPALVSGQLVGAADSDTDNLVANGSFDDWTTYPFIHIRDIDLVNNIMRAANDIAVNLSNDGSYPVSDENSISCNWIDNIQGLNTLSPGGPYDRIAVLLYNDTYATVDDNELSDVRVGVQTGNNSRANPGTPASISDNTVSSEIVGLWHNLHYLNASVWTISDNDVTDSAVSADANYAISITSILDTVAVTVSSNTISDSQVGYYLWNNPTTSTVSISGGSATNCPLGVFATNNDVDFGPAASTHTILSGVSISTPAGATVGVLVADNLADGTTVRVDASGLIQTGSAASMGAYVWGPYALLRSDNSSFTGNDTGINVFSGRAAIEDTVLTGNAATGLLVQADDAVVDAGNCASADITGLGASAGGNTVTGYGFDNATPFAIVATASPAGSSVYAQNNAFGASAGDDIEDVLYDDNNGPNAAVLFSQSGALLVSCPADVSIQCAADFPSAATGEASFIAAGGIVSATGYTVAAADSGTLVGGKGIIVRTYTITVPCGQVATCDQIITVDDTTPPLISSCAPDQAASADTLCAALVPDFTAGVLAGDNCAIASITQSPLAGTSLGLGAHLITLTATDTAGLTAQCTATLNITDQTDPFVVSCAGDQAASADATCQALMPDFIALSIFDDNCDSSLTLTQSPAAGTPVGLGTTVVTITATDDAGNHTSCTANFTVTDTTAPTISTCAPAQVASADAACLATVPDFTLSTVAADNCSVASITQSPLVGTPVRLGVTSVTITVTDGAGLTVTCDTTFTVNDTTAPDISSCAPSLALVATGPGCTAILPDLTALVSASDNCDPTLLITQSPLAGTSLALGNTVVTFTVTDDDANFSTCDATVTVDVPAVLFVDQDAVGGDNNGSSWADAYLDLQDALDAVACIGAGQIWVAQGVYHPDRATADRNDTYQMLPNVAIYGGFDATETLLSQRDPDANVTVLSGDIGAPNVHTDNSYSVVTASGTNPTAILDGFTITRGSAGPSGRGAGLLMQKGSPTIARCIFTLNQAFRGGAVYAEDSAPAFVRCTFLANTAGDGGGAIRAVTSAVDVVNGRFLANAANVGGAVYNTAASDSTFTNCIFSGNSAVTNGGALHNSISSLATFTNCSLTANTANQTGGLYTTGLATQIVAASTILYGNTDASGSTEQAQIRAVSSGSISADYCDIQNLAGGFGSGNIALDPLFVDADGADNTPGTLDDDLRPLPGSPVIDAGSNPALPADTYDLNNNANTAEQLPLDLALLSRRLDEPSVADTGLGSAPIVDIGAYEFDCSTIDCNQNGVCDSADISLGSSADCFDPAAPPNAGGFYVGGGPDAIPDECQCVADWNRDGVVNSTDVSDFINTYFDDQINFTLNGDVNCNGVSNSTDVSDFINIWFEELASLNPYSGCTL